jgi:uncharacterized protein (DUF1501 family)
LGRLLLGGARKGPAEASPTVVSIFLRGAADGLSLVVPWREDDYFRRRPTLSLRVPDPKAPDGSTCVDLDGQFALHPALAPLHSSWREGRLAIVHAVGSDDPTRSHFEAQDQMEHGAAHGQEVSGGWIARHLRSVGDAAPRSLEALAFRETLPESLRGAPSAGAVRSVAEVRLTTRSGDEKGVVRALEALHSGTDALALAGRNSLEVLRRLQALAPTDSDAGYPEDDLGRGLADIARLLNGGINLSAACLDLDGFDTHFAQGTTDGLLAGRLRSLAGGLSAFLKDLGKRADDVLVLVQTEFGRRVYENTSLGTDHGSASVLFALGAGLNGGKVLGRWPGLRDEDLHEDKDLKVTTDYRQVLAEILEKRCGNDRVNRVFPGLKKDYIGICR